MVKNRVASALRVIRGSIWLGNWEDQSFTAGWEKWDGKSLKVCSVVGTINSCKFPM